MLCAAPGCTYRVVNGDGYCYEHRGRNREWDDRACRQLETFGRFLALGEKESA